MRGETQAIAIAALTTTIHKPAEQQLYANTQNENKAHPQILQQLN